MSERTTQQLIGRLAAQLQPVRRLRPPAVRALLWLLLVAALAAWPILRYADFGVFLARIARPRIAVECAATLLTGITAVVAAFNLSIPGRSPRWLWLPLPPLLLWLGASGLGCLRNGLSLHGSGGFIGDSAQCFRFIIGASVPLAALLFWALRRARPLAPLPVAATGTLGVAALAAFILQFFHPFDVTVIDLVLHVAAVGTVIAAGTLLRRQLLGAQD